MTEELEVMLETWILLSNGGVVSAGAVTVMLTLAELLPLLLVAVKV